MPGFKNASKTWPENVGILAMELYFPAHFVCQSELERFDGASQVSPVEIFEKGLGTPFMLADRALPLILRQARASLVAFNPSLPSEKDFLISVFC